MLFVGLSTGRLAPKLFIAKNTLVSDSNKNAGVTRRKKGDKRRGRKLDPELEEFARSDEKKWRRKRKGGARLRDPREQFIIRGVANRDSRHAIDVYTERLKELIESGEEADELGRLLLDMVRLQLWRGRSITGFESYVVDVLGLDFESAQSDVMQAAQREGVTTEPVSDATAAIWIRAIAAAADVGMPLIVRVQGDKVIFEADTNTAPQVIQEVGRRLAPLAKDREPKSPKVASGKVERDVPKRAPHGKERKKLRNQETEQKGMRDGHDETPHDDNG